MFDLDGPVSTNTIIFKQWASDHRVTEFAIEVLVGNKFEAVTISKVNNAGATIQGSRVKISGQEKVRVAFDKKIDVTAVKFHVYDADTAHKNFVITEFYVLCLADPNMNWSEDVDVILNKI